MNPYNALANNSWIIPYNDGNALKYNVSYIIREVFLYQDTQGVNVIIAAQYKF